jgi:hypothetical protein
MVAVRAPGCHYASVQRRGTRVGVDTAQLSLRGRPTTISTMLSRRGLGIIEEQAKAEART